MKFGIVTPLLDARKFFRACAASLSAQQFADGSDSMTHYVRESGASREPCEDIAREFGCDYAIGSDAGIYDAIGRGLDDASAGGAEILGWLNADEQALPGALATAAAAFRANPDAAIVHGDYLLIDPGSAAVLAARREIPARTFYLRHGVNYLMSCAVFFRREVWMAAGGFDLTYRLLADKKFYLSALSSGAKAVHVRSYLGAYGVTGGNASLSPDAAVEQARLRKETGAYRHAAARKVVRAVRCVGKLLRGCYGRRIVSTTLLYPSGTPREWRGAADTGWKEF